MNLRVLAYCVRLSAALALIAPLFTLSTYGTPRHVVSEWAEDGSPVRIELVELPGLERIAASVGAVATPLWWRASGAFFPVGLLASIGGIWGAGPLRPSS